MPSLPQLIRGVVPPLVTPLKSRDELDANGLERLIEHQIAAGVAGLFILGTTGEGPSLSYRLRYELVERTCELTAGRVPVLVGVTDTSLTEALEFAQYSEGAGATAAVATPPYYFPAGQQEVASFLTALADECALPLFVYNMPSCVKLSLSFETMEQLARHPRICGVKDSAGDLPAFRELLKLKSVRPDWTILIGPELLTAEAVLMGADGGVNGGANLHPRLFVDFFHAAVRRDHPEINRLKAIAEQLSRLYLVAGDGASGYLRGLKCALSIVGLCQDQLAAPFQGVSASERSSIAAIVQELGLGTAGLVARL